MPVLQKPLSNIQYELLKLYAAGVSDDTLIEIKKMIAKHLLDKASIEAERIWNERNYTYEKIEQMVYGE